jgi:hypothetical protein
MATENPKREAAAQDDEATSGAIKGIENAVQPGCSDCIPGRVFRFVDLPQERKCSPDSD